tara:strand:- start:105 stop:941 length:837 start_codon:yes stop_codon:yes gene_type:complete
MAFVTIYILKLKENKYYVGKTNRTVNDRYREHLNGNGSIWTKKYKPISIIKHIENSSPFDEDRYVKEYMVIYGIENVRGGSYNQEELNRDTIKFLKNELRTSNNECYKCGSTSHFASECDYISIDDYIQFFINHGLNSLDNEIYYLKQKYKNIKSIYDNYESRNKLLHYVLECNYTEIDNYANEIKEYFNKFCSKDNYIDILNIQYYECIFEYKDMYKRFNDNFSRYEKRTGNISKEQNDKFKNMECEKFNKNLDNINLDIIIRQIGAIMKLKLDIIK